MSIILRIAVLTVVTAAVSVPALAQWLTYPTAGVPRLPNGSPNLQAPTPRTADDKPDFSGIWEPEKNRPCPPDGCADMQVPLEFLNGKDDPVSRCLPGGIVKLHTTPQLRKFIQIPGLIVTLNEMDATYRQIFTDGRPLPPIGTPAFKGYSVGKWEGDTLVVESTGFPDGEWLDRNGSPLTDAARITERIRRVNFGRMEIELTIDDPKAYTKPWTITMIHSIVLDTELMDYICTENEKDIGHMVGK